MKKIIYLLFISVLYLSIPANAQRMFSVVGTGELKLDPDEAVISIGVDLRHSDLKNVSRQDDSIASNIISILKDKEIKGEDILSSFIILSPFYTYSVNETNNTKPEYYNAQKTLSFILKDLKRYDEVMYELYEAGINRIDSVVFRVSNIDKHKSTVRELAIENAKEVANSLTKGFGARTGNIFTMSENFSSYKPPRPIYDFNSFVSKSYQSSKSLENVEEPSISGGQVVLTSTVSATFYINNRSKKR